MQIDLLPITQVHPFPKNPRAHSKEQITRIAKSIKEFGFNQPIVIDEESTVLVGHGRLEAAKSLKLKEIPVVQLMGLTEDKKRAYRILDNKLQNDSTWDFDTLEEELSLLESNGFELEPWGLDDLKSLFPEEEPEVEEDDFDPSTLDDQETYIKTGDLIELGKHRVMCGDFRKSEKIENVKLWITDPPYGVSYVGKTKDKLEIENDDLNEDGIETLWKDATEFALSCLDDGAACIASVPPGRLNFTFLKVWIEADVYRQQLVWVKDSMVLGHSDYHYKHEPILYGWKPGASHYFTSDRTKTSCLEYARPKISKEHPTMKPLTLWAELISNSTKKNDLILDPFLGSGTTLIAADQLNRICYGMEISPKYCQVIIERYKKHCEKSNKPFICKINGESFSGAS